MKEIVLKTYGFDAEQKTYPYRVRLRARRCAGRGAEERTKGAFRVRRLQEGGMCRTATNRGVFFCASRTDFCAKW
jgi:hypothetical protein